MKSWKFCFLVGALLPLALIASGCQSSTPTVNGKPLSENNFGHPNGLKAAGYYGAMAKMQAFMATHGGAAAGKPMPAAAPAQRQQPQPQPQSH